MQRFTDSLDPQIELIEIAAQKRPGSCEQDIHHEYGFTDQGIDRNGRGDAADAPGSHEGQCRARLHAQFD